MNRRVRNNVAQTRYRDRNKLFADFRSGDLVNIDLNSDYSPVCSLRPITKNDNGKFTYLESATFPRSEGFYKCFNNGQIALYLGRYDGYSVLLINEGLYACPVACIKKVEESNVSYG